MTTHSERQEPRFDRDAEQPAAPTGGLHVGERPVASSATARRGGPIFWLLLVAMVAGIWALWRYTDLETEIRTLLGVHGVPERETVDLIYETERMLDRLGLKPGRVDGELDPVTVDAIRLYQQTAGLTVDGEPSRALLEDLRAVAGDDGDAQ
jgi:hypothetical protein